MKQFLILWIVLISGLTVKFQNASQFFPEGNPITTGIYYYPEHWDESQWESDIKKIYL